MSIAYHRWAEMWKRKEAREGALRAAGIDMDLGSHSLDADGLDELYEIKYQGTLFPETIEAA